jgi:hypothetical protein
MFVWGASSRNGAMIPRTVNLVRGEGYLIRLHAGANVTSRRPETRGLRYLALSPKMALRILEVEISLRLRADGQQPPRSRI